MRHKTLKIIVPILLVALGMAAAVLLARSRQAPEPEEKPALGPLVEVVEARPTTVSTVVRGNGEVKARTMVDVVPQVAGRVVSVHPGLVSGGRFRAGEALLTIEPRDYELAVERAQAAVARANVALDQERAEAAVARKEWDAIHPDREPDSGLVVREPQVRQAEAELAAAKADLAVARLNLERTAVTLPFDGVVEEESVDPGQYVTVGKAVATVFATASAEVRVPLEERELAWFNVPTKPGAHGPRATVTARFGGADQVWQGHVVRIEATVDPTSRMVTAVIDIPDPFETERHLLPLLPGAFVSVAISGRQLDGVIPVPRAAVRDNATVWLVAGTTLKVTPVTVVRSELDTSYISSGIEPGDQIVVSQLDAVTDGMTVRTVTVDPGESAS